MSYTAALAAMAMLTTTTMLECPSEKKVPAVMDSLPCETSDRVALSDQYEGFLVSGGRGEVEKGGRTDGGNVVCVQGMAQAERLRVEEGRRSALRSARLKLVRAHPGQDTKAQQAAFA